MCVFSCFLGKMDVNNPWNVASVQDFFFLNCPECTFKSKEETNFQEHAIATHPMCFVFYGHPAQGNLFRGIENWLDAARSFVQVC